jgi:acetyltransferase-like isoleucine patch superfamily enzyme
MNAYMLTSARTVEPFGEHPRDCLIVNRTLASHQEEALSREGLSLAPVDSYADIHDGDEHLRFDDFVFFTPELLHEFVARSRRAQRPTVAALKAGITTLRSMAAAQSAERHGDHYEYRLYYVPPEHRRDSPRQPIVIDTDKEVQSIPMPAHIVENADYPVPLTDHLLAQIEHWSVLYAINVAALLSEMARVNRRPKLRLLWMALRARSFNQWNVLRQANRIGRGCDIHPTAYIEGSTIGNNVKIGAMAVVRESAIGDRCYIANNASVELSVLGEGCELQGGAVVQYSVLYPGAFTFAKGINASFLGKDTFVGDGATLADFRFDGRTVTVIKDGVKVDTGNIFLGGCLGHGVYLGSGCVVAPGRAIPNGMHINPNQSRVIARCEPGVEPDGHRVTRADVPRREVPPGSP